MAQPHSVKAKHTAHTHEERTALDEGDKSTRALANTTSLTPKPETLNPKPSPTQHPRHCTCADRNPKGQLKAHEHAPRGRC